eukprot:Skav222423  [mRNA]  locus=scaffold2890:193787:195334:+ [translate_table: standard]
MSCDDVVFCSQNFAPKVLLSKPSLQPFWPLAGESENLESPGNQRSAVPWGGRAAAVPEMSLFSGEEDEFPATQYYEAADSLADPEHFQEPCPEKNEREPDVLESFNSATQAYAFPNDGDNIMATQVYMDDIDACADTLHYSDENVIQDQQAMQAPDSNPPSDVSGFELMATQAYNDDDIEVIDEKSKDGIKASVENHEVSPAETSDMPCNKPCDRPPPKLPDRIKRRQSETPTEMAPVATPARSPSLSVAIDVEDSPPAPKEATPKRRRLYGKQPPPSPNPFLVPNTAKFTANLAKLPETEAKGKSKKVPAKKVRRRKQKVYFAVTGFVLDRTKRDKLGQIPGVTVVDEWSSKVTHLIAKGFRRTTKLMCAVCAGLHIVIPEFIDECIRAGEVIEEEPFLLKDEAGEATFVAKHQLSSFSLQAAVQHARSHPGLLRKKSVYWSGGSAAELEELRVLVEAAGGRWLKRKPRKPRKPQGTAAAAAVPKALWLCGSRSCLHPGTALGHLQVVKWEELE